MKTILLAFLLTSFAMADAIRFTGVVTETDTGSPVNVGETFTAWYAFHIQNTETFESWTPGALEFSCYGSYCITSLAAEYSMFLGSRGIAYDNGARFLWPEFGGDQSSGSLSADLHVNWASTSGGGVLFVAAPMNLFEHNYYFQDSFRSIRGVIQTATYTTVPEPSTFLLAGLALLAIAYNARGGGCALSSRHHFARCRARRR